MTLKGHIQYITNGTLLGLGRSSAIGRQKLHWKTEVHRNTSKYLRNTGVRIKPNPLQPQSLGSHVARLMALITVLYLFSQAEQAPTRIPTLAPPLQKQVRAIRHCAIQQSPGIQRTHKLQIQLKITDRRYSLCLYTE